MKRMLSIFIIVLMAVTLVSCKKLPDTEWASPAVNDDTVIDTKDTAPETDLPSSTEQDIVPDVKPDTQTQLEQNTVAEIPESETDPAPEPEPEIEQGTGGYIVEGWDTELKSDDYKIDKSCADRVTGRVECEYGFAKLSLAKVDGWEYSLTEYTDGCDWFGISIRPEGKYGYIHFEYRVKQLGFCGTGMKCLDIKLGNTDATVCAYSDMWSHISLPDPYQSCMIMHEYIDSWWDEYKHEAMYILSTIEFGDEIITAEQAIKSVDGLGDYVYAMFDPLTGEWVLTENGETKARVSAKK